jgi:hypothetical protein
MVVLLDLQRVTCPQVRQAAPVFALRMGAVEDTKGDRQQAKSVCGLLAWMVVLLD